jgi:hypothetical protein
VACATYRATFDASAGQTLLKNIANVPAALVSKCVGDRVPVVSGVFKDHYRRARLLYHLNDWRSVTVNGGAQTYDHIFRPILARTTIWALLK